MEKKSESVTFKVSTVRKLTLPQKLWELSAKYTICEDFWGGHDHDYNEPIGYAVGEKKTIQNYISKREEHVVNILGADLGGSVKSITLSSVEYGGDPLSLDAKVLDFRKGNKPLVGLLRNIR